MIHVDTDVCDRPGFDVARHHDGKVRDDRELVACVIKRLSQMIDADVLAEHPGRIVFAIAVNEIECWLLPLIFDNDRAEKTQGCCDAASHQLRKKKRPGLAAGGKKFRTAYIELVREFRKRKDVDSARKRSPSLDAFVADLDAKCAPAAPPAVPG